MGVFMQPPFWATHSWPQATHARLAVVTPSAAIFTTDQAKLRAGLDWLAGDPRDALIDGYVLSAQQAVEADTGVALLTQTIDVFLDRFPSPYDGSPIELPRRVVTSVTSVIWTNTSGVVQAPLDPTMYTLDAGTLSAPARLALSPTGVWPSDVYPWPPITVRLVVGYANLAALQAAASGLVDAVGLRVAHAANVGRDRFTEANLRDEYAELIAPYQLVTVG